METLRKVEGKDLRVVVQALQEKKENDWTAMGGQRDGEDAMRRDDEKNIEGIEGSFKTSDEAKKRRRMGRFPLA